MLEFDVDTDKLIKPITKSVESLKRAKDPGLRDVLKKGLEKQLDELEKASKAFVKSKPIVDEKTFEEKKKQVQTFTRACKSANEAVKKVLDLPIHGAESDGKSKSSVPVKEVPKNVKKPYVADLPIVGDQLKELGDKISAAITKLDKDFAGFQSSFVAGNKESAIEVKIPMGMTNMIELAAKKGTIALPDEQAFEATITFNGIKKQTAEGLGNFQKEFFGEVGRALEPLKKQVANAFKEWNKEFAEIEREYNKDKAKDLFGCINDYFKNKLPKFIEEELQTAAMKALTDAVPKGQESLIKGVKASIQANYNGFAEFEVTFPDKPDGLGKSFKDADSAVSSLGEAAKEIGEGYAEVQASSKKLQAAVAKGDKSAESKDLQKALSRLQGGVDEADAARQSLYDHLGPVNKKLRENKDTFKEDKDIKYDELSKGLNAALRELKGGGGTISHELKHLTETVDAAKKLLTTFDTLYGKGGGEAPDQKKADAFKQEFDKFVKGLTLKSADFKKKLEISFDLALLKTVSEKFK